MSNDTATTFFAVKLQPHETPQNVALLILRTAHDERLLFWVLEVLDLIEVGSSRFLRVRTDMAPRPVVARLLAQGRTVIASEEGTYILRHPDGRHGGISMLSMHNVPRPGFQRKYPGTKQWEAGLAS